MIRLSATLGCKGFASLVIATAMLSGCSSSSSTSATDGGTAGTTTGGTDTTGTTTGVTDAGTTGETTGTTTLSTETGTAGDTTGTASGGTDTAGGTAGTATNGTTSTGGADTGGTTTGGTSTGGTTGGTGDSDTLGDANCPALTGSGDVSAIAGLFDVTSMDAFGEDVAYVQIANNGQLTVYDYQQDDLDQGENCYLIFTGENALSPAGGNNYMDTFYTDFDANCDTETEAITIVRTASGIDVTFIDENDEDEDGDTTDTIVESYPVPSGISVESFNRCE